MTDEPDASWQARDESPFRRQREEKNPPFTGGGQPFSDISTLNTRGGSVRQSARSYKCPRCSGEFNAWDKETRTGGRVNCCPFCALERRQYDPEEGDDE